MPRTEQAPKAHNQTILGLIEATAKQTPFKVAIQQTSGRRVSYSALIDRARRIGAHLQARGFQSGDRALLLSKPGVDAVAWVLGVMYAGGVSVIADPGMGRTVYAERVKAARPKWALVDDAIILLSAVPPLMALARRSLDVPDVPRLADLRIFHHGNHPLLGCKYADFRWLLRHIKPVPKISQSLEQEAIIVFTSGTTSQPKAVVHTVGSLVATLSSIGKIIKPDDDAIFYTNLPYFLLIGIGLGVTVVVETKKPKPKSVLRALRKYRASIIFGPPAEVLPLVEHCRRKGLKLPGEIEQIYLGSAPVYRSFLKKLVAVLPLATTVTCLYGMTEILPIAAIDGRQKLATEIDGDLLGAPVSQIATKIATDGELIVSGTHMCKQYLGDQTLKAIHTGDLVRLEGEQLLMVGRKKDMILRGDYNIYPGLYEPSIESIPGVRACAMVGIYDEGHEDETIVVAIESDGSRQLRKVDIETSLRSGPHSIDSHAFPDRIEFMKLPRSGRQLKVNKLAIKQLLGQDV